MNGGGWTMAKDDVSRFHFSEMCMGYAIEADVARYPEGLHASVYGGERPHIGAVSVANQVGNVDTTQFPGHKDGVVSQSWAEAFADAGLLPAVVEAGIHYDELSAEGIREVLNATERLLARAIEAVK